MAELYIFSKDDEFLNILSEDDGIIDTWFKDYQNHVPDEPFIFNIDSNSDLLSLIVEENQVAFFDRDNDLRLARIKEIYEETTHEGNIVRVKCEPSYLELYDHFIEDRRVVEGTAQTALNRALEGSRYVGEVTTELGLATDNFYWIDGIEALFKILETWGGALKDTITLNDKNEIIERKIWIMQRLGSDNGLIVEPDYNAETISRDTLSYTETALWGQGASLEMEDEDGNLTGGYTRYITFEDVEWRVSRGDPVDKPKGQKWVGDPQALEKDGLLHNGVRKHKFGHFSNQDYETPEELLEATWLELQERKLKEIVHEAVIYESDKKISLGDTVSILNRRYNKPIELQSQITGIEYDILYPNEEIKIVVGKYIDMNEDPLQKEVNDLKEKVKKPQRPTPVSKDSYPDIKPSTPENVSASGAFQSIQLYWDYADEIFIKHYEVYGSQIKDFVPDDQHLLWRGQVSAYGHAVGTDQTWYYRIRAVNYQGTGSDFSEQVEASTVRIINDDILFGSLTADLLADNLEIADKLSQNTIDAINAGPMQEITYTQQEIEDTENRLTAQLNDQIGNINLDINDLINRTSGVEGSVTNIIQDINTIDGSLTTTINKLTNVDGIVSDHTLTLNALPGKLSAKAEKSEVYTREVTDALLSDKVSSSVYTNKMADLDLSISGISGRVSNTETNINTLTGEVSSAKSDIARLDINSDEITQRVTSLTSTVNGKENQVYKQSTAPSHSNGRLWLDTSKTPNVLNRSTGSAWVKATPTSASEVGAYSSSSGTALAGRVTSAEGSITTLAGEVSLKASQTSVNNLTGRMSNAETTLNLLPDQLEAKVSKNGVISEINATPESIRIASKLIHLSGTSLIDNAVIGTAAIANGAITNLKIGTGAVDTLQVRDGAITNAKILSLNADKVNATTLSAITSNLGTVRAGRLLSNNNNMDLNLNTGTLRMQNADLTLGGGASIRFENTGNQITYSRYDSATIPTLRTAGLGVGTAIGGNHPYAYLGTTPLNGGVIDTLHENFTGLIVNTSNRIREANAANSIVGARFRLNSNTNYDRGILFDFTGSPTITFTNGHIANYSMGTEGAPLAVLYNDRIYSRDFNIFNPNPDSNFGYVFKIIRDGTPPHFRGRFANNENYYLGTSVHRWFRVYMSNSPEVSSDERLKSDKRDLNLGLDFILDLKPMDYILNRNNDSKRQYGIIAQQLRSTFLSHGIDAENIGMLNKGEDGMYGLQYEQLIPILIKSDQDIELKFSTKITNIEDRLDRKDLEIQYLKQKVSNQGKEIEQLKELLEVA